jgi:uncharacterized protein with GYD domain
LRVVAWAATSPSELVVDHVRELVERPRAESMPVDDDLGKRSPVPAAAAGAPGPRRPDIGQRDRKSNGGHVMPKYLIKASYTAEGTKGLLKDGGSKRAAVVQKVIEGLGGKLEAFYYAFGDADVFAIIDVPDATAAAAFSLTVNAAGAVQVSTTPLVTPREIDEACKRSVKYRAPGA